MKLPVTFEQFAKDPVKGLLFIVIVAVGYLYVDNRMNYTSQIEACSTEQVVLRQELNTVKEQLRRSDSTMARAAAKLELLSELGKIK